ERSGASRAREGRAPRGGAALEGGGRRDRVAPRSSTQEQGDHERSPAPGPREAARGGEEGGSGSGRERQEPGQRRRCRAAAPHGRRQQVVGFVVVLDGLELPAWRPHVRRPLSSQGSARPLERRALRKTGPSKNGPLERLAPDL